MEDYLNIALCVLAIVIILGIVIGLYLSQYSTSIDEEEYECDAKYAEPQDEKD